MQNMKAVNIMFSSRRLFTLSFLFTSCSQFTDRGGVRVLGLFIREKVVVSLCCWEKNMLEHSVSKTFEGRPWNVFLCGRLCHMILKLNNQEIQLQLTIWYIILWPAHHLIHCTNADLIQSYSMFKFSKWIRLFYITMQCYSFLIKYLFS